MARNSQGMFMNSNTKVIN